MAQTDLKKLSIIIPCYNEDATLAHLVDRVLNADTSGLELEIVIVNDASSDKSAEIAKSAWIGSAPVPSIIVASRKTMSKCSSIMENI